MTRSFLQLLTAGAAVAATASASSPTVSFPNGAVVTGNAEIGDAGNPVNVYRGIRYADAPIGEGRWKPTKFKPLEGNVTATSNGNVCPSRFVLPPRSSEDCLFINVCTPPGVTPESNLPVMVWVHGGGFVLGSSNEFDGKSIMGTGENKFIYVSFNYRISLFGFFSNRQILDEAGGANFGLQDQEIAFAWVKKYIKQFGGNVDDITAFGVSAGAMSISLHMIARDGNQQHFKRAIMESGGYTTVHDTFPPAKQENLTQMIAQGVGCDDADDVLACLRQATTSDLFAVGGYVDWKPTVDNVFLSEAPSKLLLDGNFRRVPMISGTNANEGWESTNDVTDASQYETFVRERFSQLTEAEFPRVNELYPASSFQTAHHRISEVFGDIIFICPTETFAYTMAQTAEPPVYHYYFNFTTTQPYGYPLVVHARDQAFVFNWTDLPSDNETKDVVNYFQTYWTNFGLTGSPNVNGTAQPVPKAWPQFNDAKKQQLVIQPELAIESNSVNLPQHSERCAFWLDVEKRIAAEVAFI